MGHVRWSLYVMLVSWDIAQLYIDNLTRRPVMSINRETELFLIHPPTLLISTKIVPLPKPYLRSLPVKKHTVFLEHPPVQ